MEKKYIVEFKDALHVHFQPNVRFTGNLEYFRWDKNMKKINHMEDTKSKSFIFLFNEFVNFSEYI